MKIKNGFLLREVAGTSIVVPVGAAAKSFNGMINLNEVGAFLWRKMENDTTEEDLVKALLEEYDVTEELAAADVKAYVEKMRKAGVIDG